MKSSVLSYFPNDMFQMKIENTVPDQGPVKRQCRDCFYQLDLADDACKNPNGNHIFDETKEDVIYKFNG